ncbi:hypothetical protein [Halomonas saccharevitans]|uniref:Cytochrome oxidase Cu insertion factor, SCO1/SenC/PrrC family n=1 Tax=Halomonas saccharevitans TaxID=416872 RepID=A0A1I6ZUT3_9GAMM|nr:hypothetical protein [Halomonas saccharevitans]SFT66448.1 hypothetical protein SAMN04487956_11368 [Halomonas saccharevitans]
MTHTERQRLKLLALLAIFALPLVLAWGMVQWRLGIPEGRTAHGELAPTLPSLDQWPLTAVKKDRASDWLLVFDCSEACAERADRWWRLHRALGRDADRVSRLRIGGEGKALPGAAVAQWTDAAEWRGSHRLWILDPEGRAVLGYGPEVAASDVLTDLRRLLRLNPESPLAQYATVQAETLQAETGPDDIATGDAAASDTASGEQADGRG